MVFLWFSYGFLMGHLEKAKSLAILVKMPISKKQKPNRTARVVILWVPRWKCPSNNILPLSTPISVTEMEECTSERKNALFTTHPKEGSENNRHACRPPTHMKSIQRAFSHAPQRVIGDAVICKSVVGICEMHVLRDG